MTSASSANDELVAWLQDPQTYGSSSAQVQHVETHISHVFLAGNDVYKLKKMLRFDFLDFSTLAAREHACREELRLNRRLAAEVYLEVVPITRDASGELALDGTGAVVDWLVHMRRIKTELSLEELLRSGKLQPTQIDRLSELLARFYRELPPLPLSSQDYRAKYLQHVRDNQAELKSSAAPLPGFLIDRVHAFQRQLILLRPHLLDERVAAGKIIDGHGDLRPEHICLEDPPVIFDCLEFNADFRRADQVDELAFLAAECDFLGAEWVGERLLANYLRATNDAPSPILWAFYKTYRACVRAKIADLRSQQTERSARDAATRETLSHLHLADRYSAPWVRPLVIAIGGLPGCGKSTLARAVAAELGAERLSTDELRTELFANQPEADKYSATAKQHIYEELFRRATRLHAEGLTVVLDGNFGLASEIVAAQKLAALPNSVFLAVECICDRETAHTRIAQRQAQGDDASEATVAVHDHARTTREAWPASVRQIQIETRQPLDNQTQELFAALRRELSDG